MKKHPAHKHADSIFPRKKSYLTRDFMLASMHSKHYIYACVNKDSMQSKGGLARAEILSPEERSDIAAKAAAARWNLPKATHEGDLHLGSYQIHCAVLEDGRRVLTQSDFMRALGRARQAKGREYYEGDVNLPAFLTAKNLKPYIDNGLYVTSSQIVFKPLKGAKAFGYPAELLPKVCEVFLKARDEEKLAHTQVHIARQADVLMRALAHVGIAALVDEATGFQEVRDRKALQKILEAYLLKEFAAWAKRFPDEFYKELFRLRGWKWDGMSIARPAYVGKLTNDLVYERLAPGILDELKRRNPKTESGYRKQRHHQWLTEDIGHPALAQHLHATIVLMRASSDWPSFYRMVERALPKKTDQLPLLLDD